MAITRHPKLQKYDLRDRTILQLITELKIPFVVGIANVSMQMIPDYQGKDYFIATHSSQKNKLKNLGFEIDGDDPMIITRCMDKCDIDLFTRTLDNYTRVVYNDFGRIYELFGRSFLRFFNTKNK